MNTIFIISSLIIFSIISATPTSAQMIEERDRAGIPGPVVRPLYAISNIIVSLTGWLGGTPHMSLTAYRGTALFSIATCSATDLKKTPWSITEPSVPDSLLPSVGAGSGGSHPGYYTKGACISFFVVFLVGIVWAVYQRSKDRKEFDEKNSDWRRSMMERAKRMKERQEIEKERESHKEKYRNERAELRRMNNVDEADVDWDFEEEELEKLVPPHIPKIPPMPTLPDPPCAPPLMRLAAVVRWTVIPFIGFWAAAAGNAFMTEEIGDFVLALLPLIVAFFCVLWVCASVNGAVRKTPSSLRLVPSAIVPIRDIEKQRQQEWKRKLMQKGQMQSAQVSQMRLQNEVSQQRQQQQDLSRQNFYFNDPQHHGDGDDGQEMASVPRLNQQQNHHEQPFLSQQNHHHHHQHQQMNDDDNDDDQQHQYQPPNDDDYDDRYSDEQYTPRGSSADDSDSIAGGGGGEPPSQQFLQEAMDRLQKVKQQQNHQNPNQPMQQRHQPPQMNVMSPTALGLEGTVGFFNAQSYPSSPPAPFVPMPSSQQPISAHQFMMNPEDLDDDSNQQQNDEDEATRKSHLETCLYLMSDKGRWWFIGDYVWDAPMGDIPKRSALAATKTLIEHADGPWQDINIKTMQRGPITNNFRKQLATQHIFLSTFITMVIGFMTGYSRGGDNAMQYCKPAKITMCLLNLVMLLVQLLARPIFVPFRNYMLLFLEICLTAGSLAMLVNNLDTQIDEYPLPPKFKSKSRQLVQANAALTPAPPVAVNGGIAFIEWISLLSIIIFPVLVWLSWALRQWYMHAAKCTIVSRLEAKMENMKETKIHEEKSLHKKHTEEENERLLNLEQEQVRKQQEEEERQKVLAYEQQQQQLQSQQQRYDEYGNPLPLDLQQPFLMEKPKTKFDVLQDQMEAALTKPLQGGSKAVPLDFDEMHDQFDDVLLSSRHVKGDAKNDQGESVKEKLAEQRKEKALWSGNNAAGTSISTKHHHSHEKETMTVPFKKTLNRDKTGLVSVVADPLFDYKLQAVVAAKPSKAAAHLAAGAGIAHLEVAEAMRRSHVRTGLLDDPDRPRELDQQMLQSAASFGNFGSGTFAAPADGGDHNDDDNTLGSAGDASVSASCAFGAADLRQQHSLRYQQSTSKINPKEVRYNNKDLDREMEEALGSQLASVKKQQSSKPRADMDTKQGAKAISAELSRIFVNDVKGPGVRAAREEQTRIEKQEAEELEKMIADLKKEGAAAEALLRGDRLVRQNVAGGEQPWFFSSPQKPETNLGDAAAAASSSASASSSQSHRAVSQQETNDSQSDNNSSKHHLEQQRTRRIMTLASLAQNRWLAEHLMAGHGQSSHGDDDDQEQEEQLLATKVSPLSKVKNAARALAALSPSKNKKQSSSTPNIDDVLLGGDLIQHPDEPGHQQQQQSLSHQMSMMTLGAGGIEKDDEMKDRLALMHDQTIANFASGKFVNNEQELEEAKRAAALAEKKQQIEAWNMTGYEPPQRISQRVLQRAALRAKKQAEREKMMMMNENNNDKTTTTLKPSEQRKLIRQIHGDTVDNYYDDDDVQQHRDLERQFRHVMNDDLPSVADSSQLPPGGLKLSYFKQDQVEDHFVETGQKSYEEKIGGWLGDLSAKDMPVAKRVAFDRQTRKTIASPKQQHKNVDDGSQQQQQQQEQPQASPLANHFDQLENLMKPKQKDIEALTPAERYEYEFQCLPIEEQRRINAEREAARALLPLGALDSMMSRTVEKKKAEKKVAEASNVTEVDDDDQSQQQYHETPNRRPPPVSELDKLLSPRGGLKNMKSSDEQAKRDAELQKQIDDANNKKQQEEKLKLTSNLTDLDALLASPEERKRQREEKKKQQQAALQPTTTSTTTTTTLPPPANDDNADPPPPASPTKSDTALEDLVAHQRKQKLLALRAQRQQQQRQQQQQQQALAAQQTDEEKVVL